MRFEIDSVIMDDDLTSGSLDSEMVGYLWATSPLVAMTNYEELIDKNEALGFSRDEFQINFYPIYNVETGIFRVEYAITTPGATVSGELPLTTEELSAIQKEFESYYTPRCECDSFLQLTETWKAEMNIDREA